MTSPSQVPVRFPSGVTSDTVWGPLANCGSGNPFFYQIISDDLMGPLVGNDNWKSDLSGTGAAVAEVAGDGGIWLLTSSTAGAGTAGIIGNIGNFIIPPPAFTGTLLTATLFPSKKLFFLARISLAAPATSTLYAGLMPAATTTALPTDGLFFIFTNATTVALAAYSASTLLWSIPIPAAAITNWLGVNLWLDIGFYMDRLMNVYAFFGFPLVGWVPASAWTGSGLASIPPPLGAVAAYQVSVSGAWTPSTALLTPGIILTGTTQTAEVDFLMAAKER
jgi:hypothetical protein